MLAQGLERDSVLRKSAWACFGEKRERLARLRRRKWHVLWLGWLNSLVVCGRASSLLCMCVVSCVVGHEIGDSWSWTKPKLNGFR